MHIFSNTTTKLALMIVLLSLAGCGSTPVKEQSTAQKEPEISISLENITQMLDEADTQEQGQRTFTYLNVTQALLEADEIDWARNTLMQLSPYDIPADQYIRYSVLSAALAVAQGQPYKAKAILWNEPLNELAANAPASEQAKLSEMRAQLLYNLGEYRESIEQRLALHELLSSHSEDTQANNEGIWQTLMELPYDELKVESQIQSDMLARGWYTLAALSKDNQTNLKGQVRELETWVLNWPEHPASLNPPADLQLLKQLSEEQPERIAILLPFSGRFEAASNAIYDGIMAAYYDASTSESFIPELRVYDTSSKDINEVYDNAVLEGAQLIIGPLEKEKIQTLALRLELPIPTLALSRIEGEMDYSPGLFQFGLPIEDEAEQVAEQAWRDGHRRAMILAPSSTSGDRSVNAFIQRWQSLGGELAKDYRYKNQSGYSNLVKKAVKVGDSEQRRKRVRTIIGKHVEFEPRRRKDIDFIFLHSQASQARQIKPILAFHYAGDLPVYAIKDIYNGKEDIKRDRDLNNIRFTTLPWFFDTGLPEKDAIDRYNQQTRYQFLYALGIDSYHLYPRLRQLKEIKQAHFYGTTGKLRLDEKQKIKREQIWARFTNGKAEPIATTMENNGL